MKKLNESGISLIATLWIITVLSVIATEFLYSISLETKIGKNQLDRVKTLYVAKSGFEMAVAALQNDATPYDSLSEEWSMGIEDQIQDGIVPNKANLFQVKVVDELSKIDLNEAEPQLLSRVIELTGAEAQTANTLSQTIVQKRAESRFRTVGELANIEGMTNEILYGASGNNSNQTSDESSKSQAASQPLPLIRALTVYSVDRNQSSDGQNRVNINQANAQQISGRLSDVITQGEANAIIAQRSQSQYSNIGALFDAPAITQNSFNQIRDRITVSDENTPPGGGQKVNINSASLQQLQSLPGIDQGLADDIIKHRQANGNFPNIDAIRNVKVVDTNDMRQIADRITTTNDNVLRGRINLNTAPLEILSILPSMDANKAQAIIDRRESQNPNQNSSPASSENQGNPFTSIGQLLELPGIDQNTFRQVSNLFTYRSQAFSVESVGLADDGSPVGYCMGVIDRSEDGIQIRYWKQR